MLALFFFSYRGADLRAGSRWAAHPLVSAVRP
jgi:hypothetical protein